MKRTFIIATYICILFRGGLTYAQGGKVNSTEIAIMKPTDNSKGLLLGDPSSKAITIFGNPSSTKKSFNEMEGKTVITYRYGTSTELNFVDDKLYSFDLTIGPPFTLGKINGTSVKSVSDVPTLYPGLVTVKSLQGATGPPPMNGGSPPFFNELWKSAEVYINDSVQDSYFQIRYTTGSITKLTSASVFVK